MRRRLLLFSRFPSTMPRDVRKAINRDLWRLAWRSPLFWIPFVALMAVLFAANLGLLVWTEGTYFQRFVPAFILIAGYLVFDCILNRLFHARCRSVWLAHQVCPDCFYNLTGNTSGVCPECGTACTTPENPLQKILAVTQTE